MPAIPQVIVFQTRLESSFVLIASGCYYSLRLVILRIFEFSNMLKTWAIILENSNINGFQVREAS